MYTDASDFGIGGVLFQVVCAIWQPIAFISKSLTPTQIRWSTIQKEAYAIFYCCTQLDYLIRDRTFTIHTDHLNITYMKQNPTSMVARWFILLLHARTPFYCGIRRDLVKMTCPKGQRISSTRLPLREMKAFRGSSESSVLNIQTSLVINQLRNQRHLDPLRLTSHSSCGTKTKTVHRYVPSHQQKRLLSKNT